jgi:hypothetical protein
MHAVERPISAAVAMAAQAVGLPAGRTPANRWQTSGAIGATLPAMRRARSIRRFVAAALSGLIVSSLPAHAQVAGDRAVSAAADPMGACEAAARQSLAAQGAAPAAVTFNAAPALQANLSNASQTVLRGSGRWRNAGGLHSFDYICNVDPQASGTVGVVLRDSTSAAARTAAPRTPSEPDMSHVSPAACESRAAEALKQRWPGVSQISFDRATRRLLQDSPSRSRLHGHGRALPTPDSPSTHFGFDCELDPRDGRVLAMRLSG